MLTGKRFISLRIEAIEAELAAGVKRFEAEDVRYLMAVVRVLDNSMPPDALQRRIAEMAAEWREGGR